MRTLDADTVLIIVHIPKTAGSTLQHIVKKNYPPGTYYARREVKELLEMTTEQRQKLRCVITHAQYGIHEMFGGKPYVYATFLREPVDRLISQYYHFSVTFRLKSNERIASLEEWFETMHSVKESQIRRLVYRKEFSDLAAPLPENPVEQALDNLDKDFALAGLTERFDESLLMLADFAGWKHLTYTRRMVGTVRKERKDADITPEQREKMAALLADEIVLYNKVVQKFEQRIAEQDASFSQRLAAFRRRNQWYQWLTSSTESIRESNLYRQVRQRLHF